MFSLTFFLSITIVLFFLEAYRVIRGLLIGRKHSSWKCKRCGHCCGYKVILTKEDVQNIESIGHKKEDFIVGKYMKRNKGKCVFLRKKGKSFLCLIYKNRPDVCRKFPFYKLFNRYDMAMNTKCPEIKKLI